MVYLIYAYAFAAFQCLPILAKNCRNELQPNYKTPIAAGGWSFRLVANGLTRPRSILFDSKGALLVVDAREGIKRLQLTDDGGTCLSVAQQRTLIDSPDLNHGIAISPDGKTLYASTSDRVYSWSYDVDAGTVGHGNKTLVANMSNSDHTTRTLLLSAKRPGTLLVSRGSASNIDDEAATLSTGHSQLRAFDIGSIDDASQPFDFATQGTLLGWGLRNSVGIAEEPVNGGIYTVENSADQLERDGVDIHRDNPAEELNFHGYLNQSTENQGGNYGYPKCFAIWSTDGFPNVGNMKTGDQFTLSQSQTLNDTTCSTKHVSPKLVFQAHTAPLDLKFTPNGSEAFVTFHGSWNRDEPVGYKLSSIRFFEGAPTDAAESQTSTTDIMSNADINDCPSKCFRPVGLAWDNKGRLFMTSDSTGEIYVLQKSDVSVSDPTGSTPTSSPDAAASLVPHYSAFFGCLAATMIFVLGGAGVLGLLP